MEPGTITNSDLNRPCFAWQPYGKSGLFKTELVIAVITQSARVYFLKLFKNVITVYHKLSGKDHEQSF